MQAAPAPSKPVTRAQKLEWYTGQLMSEAAAEEKAGSSETAITHYLQAADILLLLAKVEQNYNSWKAYTDNAAHCQQRARHLIAVAPKDQAP